MKNIILADKKRYKGNLHMHTTRSDGHWDPDAAIRIYQEHGYDFLALTDHRNPSTGTKWDNSQDAEAVPSDHLLLLPGVEWDTGNGHTSPVYHIIGVGMDRETAPLYDNGLPTPQTIIDEIHAAGGQAILCHPAWSVMDPNEMYDLHGFMGCEIHNAVSGPPSNPERDDSSLYFDQWATHGLLVPAMAADDAHDYPHDACISFLMLGAKSLCKKAVMEALIRGDYYATQGPQFTEIVREEEEIRVRCSADVTEAFIYTNWIWCPDRYQKVTGGSFRYSVTPNDRYVRIEIRDGEGRRAWCSPFSVE